MAHPRQCLKLQQLPRLKRHTLDAQFRELRLRIVESPQARTGILAQVRDGFSYQPKPFTDGVQVPERRKLLQQRDRQRAGQIAAENLPNA